MSPLSLAPVLLDYALQSRGFPGGREVRAGGACPGSARTHGGSWPSVTVPKSHRTEDRASGSSFLLACDIWHELCG